MQNKRINNLKKIMLIFFVFTFLFSNVKAFEINSKDNIDIGETITVTLYFETSLGAYDSLEVTYNEYALEYVSGDPLHENVWHDSSEEQLGIQSKTYVFRGKANGISTIDVNINGAVSANETMDVLGNINVSKTITIGTGYTKGDLNSDGAINSLDAALIIDKYKNNNITQDDIEIADMNNDGSLNALDSAMIIDKYKNNE